MIVTDDEAIELKSWVVKKLEDMYVRLIPTPVSFWKPNRYFNLNLEVTDSGLL